MNISKQSLSLLTLGLSLTVATVPSWSQPSHSGAAAKGHPMGHTGQGKGGDRGMERIAKQLNLTPQQQARIKKVADSTMAQGRAVQISTTLKPEQKRAKIMQIMKTMHTQMNAILTPAQRQKVAAMRQQRMKQMQSMRSAPGAKR